MDNVYQMSMSRVVEYNIQAEYNISSRPFGFRFLRVVTWYLYNRPSGGDLSNPEFRVWYG